MSDCKIPAGVNAKIIDQESCVIESEGKIYIQFNKLDASISKSVPQEEQQKGIDGLTHNVQIPKEVITDVYIGSDVNGDGITDKVIVTTTINSQNGNVPNTVETKVYFGQDQDQYLDSTKVFKSLNSGRTQDWSHSIRNSSALLGYNATYPVDGKSVLWLYVP